MAVSKRYNKFEVLSVLMYNLACAYHSIGEEEQIYKPLLIRSYHFAHSIGQHFYANLIKRDAKDDFGIIIE